MVEVTLKPCPLCEGVSKFGIHRIHGTGSSGMEIPDVSILCTSCGLSLPKRPASEWIRGKGTVDLTETVKAELAEQWNHRTEAVAALEARVRELEAKVVEQAEELLWEAYDKGFEKPDGRWTHNFMSDGEWLARQCGFDPRLPDYDAAAIKAEIPDAARKALQTTS